MIKWNKKNILTHFFGWIVYLTPVSWALINRFPESNVYKIIAMDAVLQMLLFYFNYFFIVPKLYFRKKLIPFFMAKIASYVVIIILSFYGTIVIIPLPNKHKPKLIELFLPHKPPKPPFRKPTRPRRMKPRPKPRRAGLAGVQQLPFKLITMLVLIFSSLLRITEHLIEKEKETSLLQAEMKEAELNFLKSQINPHFLFNVLNNIYSLSIENSPQTSDMILKLSSMLRFITYESSQQLVSLNKEIEYIKSFIELQKLKDSEMNNISFESTPSNFKIAPMLLIPFVENAFKHSNVEDVETGWINIKLHCVDGKLTFDCSNSLLDIQHQKDEVGGVGIENVKQRLKLLYPESHSLTVDANKEQQLFKVLLEIQLS